MNKNVLIGLTGGIGSGKSTVSALFAQKNIPVIDADVISRSLTQANGLAIETIRQTFGDHLIDANHALNRQVMRELVFSDPDAKKKLEAILHPLIQQEIQRRLAEIHSPYVILDIPLLIESISRYRHWLNQICVVDCDKTTQIARVKQRSGLSEEMITRIIHQQASREERLLHADEVIRNGHTVSMADLAAQVDVLHDKWLKQ